jgi:hypothetical protein
MKFYRNPLGRRYSGIEAGRPQDSAVILRAERRDRATDGKQQ